MNKYSKRLLKPKPTDLLFILLIVALLGGVFLFFRRKIVDETFTFKISEASLLNTKNSVYLPLRVGDKEVNDFGKTTSEIVNVESYSTSLNERDIYIEVKINVVFNPKNKSYTYKGKRIAYGESFVFNFPEARVTALSLGSSKTLNENTKSGTKKILVQLRANYDSFADTHGVPDYLASAFTVGEEMRSTNGEVLAKIESVSVQPAARVISSSGTLIAGTDPILKDIFMTLEIKTYEQGDDILMFNRLPLRIDQYVPLFIKGRISAWPTIIKIL